MSKKAEQTPKQGSTANSGDEMHCLAVSLEQTRASLQTALLDRPYSLNVLAEHFLYSLHNNSDISELVNCKFYEEQVVQPDAIVQPNHKLIAESLSATMSNLLRQDDQGAVDLEDVHFLPVFLLKVADKIIADQSDDTDICGELKRLRRELQNVRQAMVLKNRKLVAFIAHRQKTGNVGFHDVMQEGMVGLLKAVDRFDHRRDIRFSTYATYWIKQTISRLVVRQDRIVRLPFGLAEKASVVFEIMRNCYLNENRWPSIVEIQAKCDLGAEEIKTIVSYFQSAPALTSTDNEEEETDMLAGLEQHAFPQPMDVLAEQNLKQFIIEALDSLPQREADILTLRFGLKNRQETTLQGVAEQMNLTRERIRQIQNAALATLKQKFAIELHPYIQAGDSH